MSSDKQIILRLSWTMDVRFGSVILNNEYREIFETTKITWQSMRVYLSRIRQNQSVILSTGNFDNFLVC